MRDENILPDRRPNVLTFSSCPNLFDASVPTAYASAREFDREQFPAAAWIAATAQHGSWGLVRTGPFCDTPLPNGGGVSAFRNPFAVYDLGSSQARRRHAGKNNKRSDQT
jgi:hypothetical protein